ncbi:MAG: hypothetical protein Tsb002_03490 [Wenzhouxiangellaceae bacterium]
MSRAVTLVVLFVVALVAGCASTPPPASRVAPAADLSAALDAARDFAAVYDPEDILVIFDLDNTLLTMNGDLGSNQWYDWQSDLRDQPGCVPERVNELLATQGSLYFAGSMKPTQDNTAAIVRRLQEEDFRVMILTSRGLDFRLTTFRELRRNNLDFSHSGIPMDKDSRFDNLTYFGNKGRPVLYEDGVFMVAGQDKGIMLETLLQRSDWVWPDAIVAIDDTADKITALKTNLDDLGIPYRLFRYSGMDEAVSHFDPETAARDWERIKDSLQTIQQVMGNDNYQLPEQMADPACTN